MAPEFEELQENRTTDHGNGFDGSPPPGGGRGKVVRTGECESVEDE